MKLSFVSLFLFSGIWSYSAYSIAPDFSPGVVQPLHSQGALAQRNQEMTGLKPLDRKLASRYPRAKARSNWENVSSFGEKIAQSQSGQSFTELPMLLSTPTGKLYGTLLLPDTARRVAVPVALIIAGSGPTDRDGNNPMMKNNSLKMLAEALAKQGIASVRYDKRGVAASAEAGGKEEDLRFEQSADDAVAWSQLIRSDTRFNRLFIVGHSEGSLVGMLAAQKARPAGFVSLAGAGVSADKLIREQMKPQPKPVQDMVYPILDSLKMGYTVKQVHPLLYSLFRPSVQPYLISWFRHDPALEIRKLTMPVLIVQGTNDIQVGLSEGETLAKAQPKAKYVVIDRMNHIFKETDGDRQANLATYGNPDQLIIPRLPEELGAFIRHTP